MFDDQSSNNLSPLIFDQQCWQHRSKKIIFIQGDKISEEAEALSKKWQTFVADLALRAKEGEQVFYAEHSPDAFPGHLHGKEREQVELVKMIFPQCN